MRSERRKDTWTDEYPREGVDLRVSISLKGRVYSQHTGISTLYHVTWTAWGRQSLVEDV